MTKNERRVIDLCYAHKLGHLSSCLTTLPVLEDIYRVKGQNDSVVLANGHAGIALYTVIEANGHGDADNMIRRFGVHPERSLQHGIEVSSGSLGQAETVAVGMALGDRSKNVYLVTSDGACAEGSVWEALRIAADNRLENLRVSVVANGYSAYDRVDLDYLEHRLKSFYPVLFCRVNLFEYPEWLQGIDGHYVIMDEAKYREITK